MVQQLTDMSRFLDEHVVPDEADLITRYVVPHPGKRGRAYAYLEDTGPSVSAIVRGLRVDPEIAEMAASWNISEEAVRAAVGFYRRHRAYIDARILLEDDDWNHPDDWDET